MRIAIYGAGSLGTALGAYLAQSGVHVDLFNRNAAHVEALRAKGARVVGRAQLEVPVNAYLPAEMEGVYDLILLMTKQQDNEAVAGFLAPHLAEGGVLCTAQNGLPEPGLAEILGPRRVLGCTVNWGATLQSPGVVELTSDIEAATFALGSVFPGADSAKAAAVKEVLERMCAVSLHEDFMGYRWAKLLINATFSGSATVLGCTFGQVAGSKRGQALAQRILLECLDAAGAAAITVGPVQGIGLAKFLQKRSAFRLWVLRRIMPIAMKKHYDIKPSMLQDLEKGKPTEIAFINGVVCEYGGKHGTPTPCNDAIVRMVREMEAGERTPGVHNLDEIEKLYADQPSI